MAPLTQFFLRATGRVSGSTRAPSERTFVSNLVPYVLAALLVATAVGVKAVPGLGIGDEAPGVLLTGAVLVVALAAGWKAATFATVLAIGAVLAWFVPDNEPRTSLETSAFMLALVGEAALVIALAEFTRRAAQSLERENQRQAALADLGQVALTSRDDVQLWEQAAQRAAEDLGADAAFVLTREGDGARLSVAWPPGGTLADPQAAYDGLLPTSGTANQGANSKTSAHLEKFRAVTSSTIESASQPPALLVVARTSQAPFRSRDRAYLETLAALLGAARRRREGEHLLERSEQRLRVAQAAANIGTWEWDLSRGHMAWSDGLEVLHGLPPGTFPDSADGYLALVHPEDRDQIVSAAQGRGNGGRFDVRYRVTLPDGAERWLSTRGQVFGDDDRQRTRIVGIVADLTDQMRAEEAVRLSEERFRMMTNVAPVLIRVASGSGACAFVNERWSAFTGRPAEEQLGQGWLDSVHPEDRDNVELTLGEAVATRQPAEVEYRIKDADGEYRWVLDRTVPVDTADRGAAGFVSSCTDITDRRRAEDALRLAAESGEQLASSLDLEQTLEGLAQLAVPRFADWCAVFRRSETGAIRRVSIIHADPGRADALERLGKYQELDPDGNTIAARVVRTGEPVLARNVTPENLTVAGLDADYQLVLEELGIRSILGVPLNVQDDTIGAMVFLRGEPGRAFHDTDLTLARDLARRASVSIENARLYSDLVEREAAVARANETLTFLLDASAELSRTLDLEEMMASLARLATPRVADWCTILSLGEDKKPVVRAANHREPHWSERVRQLQERYPFSPRSTGPIMRALRDGQPAFLPEIPEQLLQAAAVDEEHLALIRELGLDSAVIVPLTGARATYGAMHFVMSGSGRRYTEEDFAMLKDLAHRAAIAMDNATLYRDAQQREQDLRRANEAKDEFMGMMSHELRTPLTIINGGARVLRARSAELDPEARESILVDIESESDRLFRMVENLLALAHLEFGDSFEVEPVHATRLTEKVIAAFRTRRPNREVVLDVQPGAETFAAQPVYLEQVVRNLLSNADKYSPQGVPITIQVRRVSEGVGEVRVQDRGVGVDPEEVDLIFERFYRSERTSRLVGGSGVGLALCKRLIEAMSGHIWARPREGGGLEVVFSLPLYEEAFV